MHHLRDLLLEKYWLPLGEASWYCTHATRQNGIAEKVFTAGIHHVASRLRPVADSLSPREVLELLAPFYAYEVVKALGISILGEKSLRPAQKGWQHHYDCSQNVSIEALLSANREQVSVAVITPADFSHYLLLDVVAQEYFGRTLGLHREYRTTRTPAEF